MLASNTSGVVPANAAVIAVVGIACGRHEVRRRYVQMLDRPPEDARKHGRLGVTVQGFRAIKIIGLSLCPESVRAAMPRLSESRDRDGRRRRGY
jgi:hypothetical protein